jgi:hypothetical protein
MLYGRNSLAIVNPATNFAYLINPFDALHCCKFARQEQNLLSTL